MTEVGRAPAGKMSTKQGHAVLETVSERVEAWRRQRDELADEIRNVLQAATAILGSLGDSERQGNPQTAPSVEKRGGRPRGYKVSAETRAKLRAAWLRRKGESTDETGKPPTPRTPRRLKRSISAAGRARIAAAQRKRWAAHRKAQAKSSQPTE